MDNEYLQLILPYFPRAFVTEYNELVLESTNNIYFRLEDVESLLDFKCKMIEFVSRSSYKGVTPYWQRYIRRGFNSFFRKDFTADNFCLIYFHLGNGVNRELCRRFILSNFDFKLLE